MSNCLLGEAGIAFDLGALASVPASHSEQPMLALPVHQSTQSTQSTPLSPHPTSPHVPAAQHPATVTLTPPTLL